MIFYCWGRKIIAEIEFFGVFIAIYQYHMFIQRELLTDILHWIDRNKILIIKGSRQVGKTTLLREIEKKLAQDGKQTFYFSVDQELGNPMMENSKRFFRFVNDQFPNAAPFNKLYLFLDEFQYLPQPGIFLKTLFDMGGDRIQIIVSGSSSLEITKNSEFLTGRKIEFFLYPLNYREFLSYKTQLRFPSDIPLAPWKEISSFFITYQAYLEEYFSEYIQFGGYPEVVKTKPQNDKKVILKELVQTYIEKDIIAFLRIEHVQAFQNLLKILCDQTGNLVNKSELSNTLNISMDTVNKYLDILEGTYVLERVSPYFTNIRKELSKMPKIYIYDSGLKNNIINTYEFDNLISGSDRENFVYNTLKSRYSRENIRFYRTISKSEIDFILTVNGQMIPVEVKSVKKAIPLPLAMRSFATKYRNAVSHQIIITDGFLFKKGAIRYIPITLLPFINFS